MINAVLGKVTNGPSECVIVGKYDRGVFTYSSSSYCNGVLDEEKDFANIFEVEDYLNKWLPTSKLKVYDMVSITRIFEDIVNDKSFCAFDYYLQMYDHVEEVVDMINNLKECYKLRLI